MNPAILGLLAPSAAGNAVPGSAKASRDSAAGGGIFGMLLNVKMGTLGFSAKINEPANAAFPALRVLEAKIAKMRNAGASEADIVSTLTAQLAASAAQALNTPTPDARAQLQATFAGALAPPGDEGNAAGSLADRLRNLAQRFLKLAALATSIAGDRHHGQQNYIAGNFLDATTARETPAPAPAPAKQTTKIAGSSGPPSASAKAATALAALARATMPAGIEETPTPKVRKGLLTSAISAALEETTSSDARNAASAIAGLSETAMPAGLKESSALGGIRGTPVSPAVEEKLASAAGQETLTSAAVKETLAPALAAAKESPAVAFLKETLAPAALEAASVSEAVAVKGTPPHPVSKDTSLSAAGAPAGQARSAAQAAVIPSIGGISVSAEPAKGAAMAATAVDASAVLTGEGTPTTGLGSPALPVADQRDGRNVKLGNVAALSPGGDTPLGRALTRAAAAGVLRETLPARSVDVPARAGTETATTNQQADSNQQATKAAAADTGAAASLKSFTSALGADARSVATPAAGGSPAAMSGPADGAVPESGNASTAFVPIVAPFSIAPPPRPIGRILTGSVSDVALPPTSSTTQPAASAPVPVPTIGLSDTGVPATVTAVTDDTDRPADANVPATKAAAPGTVLTAFVQAFESALGAIAGTTIPSQREGEPSATSRPLVPAAAATGSSSAASVPVAAPFNIERTAPEAAPAPLTYAPPADRAAIIDQVLRGVSQRNTGASSEIRFSLVPQALGDVNIQLVVSAGNVTAHVVAQTPEVRDALVAAQPQLEKSLADAGLKLQGFTVDLSGGGFAGFSQQHAHQSPSGNPPGGTAGMSENDITDDDRADAVLDAVPSFGPSVSATARAGAYNYLA